MSTSASPAILVDGVAKRFQRGERHDSLRDLIPALLRRAGRRGEAPGVASLGRDEFWAVRDLNFQVDFGRALGIIGPNGAGKSTTLKLLTGILRPTQGEIRMRGRVASLIEVSAGFHPDLTGRENVYLQGAVMGMSRREVDSQLDSIVAFSEVEDFIDTPVKRYSSGMNARLGFSIAVHVNPDVLVIDEVLSVGDMSFQKKCVERMLAFKREGVAIVFVSHNMQAIGELCDEAIVIKGNPRFQGTVGEAVTNYLRLSGDDSAGVQGDGITVTGSQLLDPSGQVVEAAAPHQALSLQADMHFSTPLSDLTFCLVVRRATDYLNVYDGNITSQELGLGVIEAGTTLRIRFDHTAHLTRGQYLYTLGVYDQREGRHRIWVVPAAGLRVDEYRTHGGVADLDVETHVETLARV
ncbi:MAG: ABC transporter ATP-binding protein [Gemmatimonadaceae bacterium]